MIPYILHMAILIAVFYLFHILLIKRETFFNVNRVLLIGYIAMAISLPIITIPAGWSLHNHLQTAYASLDEEISPTPSTSIQQEKISSIKAKKNSENGTDLTQGGILEQAKKQDPYKLWQIASNLPLSTIMKYIYLIGLFVFGMNFIIQFLTLLYKSIRTEAIKDKNVNIIEVDENISPFSFWNNIFINPTLYDWETYNQILNHEKIHINQKHSIDILIAELFLIIQWFNPFAWLYRKTIETNLEYLTDESMIKDGVDKKVYQVNLLKVAVPNFPMGLATNYNQSVLKNRIKMMNSKKSSISCSWKYILLLPLVALTMISFNDIHSSTALVENTEKKSESLTVKPEKKETKKRIAKNEKIKSNIQETTQTTKTELTKPQSIDKTNLTVIKPTQNNAIENSISEVPNKLPEIRTTLPDNSPQIKVPSPEVKRKIINQKPSEANKKLVSNTGKNKSKKSCSPTKDTNKKKSCSSNKLRSGEWIGELVGNEVCIRMHYSSSSSYGNCNSMWNSDKCFKKSAFDNIPKGNTPKDFNLVRDAGTVTFNGAFQNNEAEGTFKFASNNAFKNYLDEQDISIKESDMFFLFMTDINKEYINYLKKSGFNPTSKSIKQFAIHGIDRDELEDYTRTFKKLNNKSIDAKDLINFKIHGIDAETINEFHALGYDDLRAKDIVEVAIHGITPDYVKSIKDAGLEDLSIRQIVEFAIHGIRPNYIKSFRENGLEDISHRDIINAGIHGVNPNLVKTIKDSGFEDISMRQITEFAIHGVSANYIKGMKDLGYDDISCRDIVNAKIHGVNPKYIKAFKDAGLKDMDMNDIIQFAIHGIDADYVEAFKEAGFKNFSNRDIIQAGIHGVTPTYIERIVDLGFKDVSIRDFINAKIHGVSASYIKRAREKGFKSNDLDKYVDLKINASSW